MNVKGYILCTEWARNCTALLKYFLCWKIKFVYSSVPVAAPSYWHIVAYIHDVTYPLYLPNTLRHSNFRWGEGERVCAHACVRVCMCVPQCPYQTKGAPLKQGSIGGGALTVRRSTWSSISLSFPYFHEVLLKDESIGMSWSFALPSGCSFVF
jgi:hypothetical protein